MTKINNNSDHPVPIIVSNMEFNIPPGGFVDVKDVSTIQNLPEIRRDVTIGRNLSEVGTCVPSGRPLRG